jgi:hypothetical protein
MKTCKKCDQILEFSSFFRKGYNASGSIKYYSQCKDCVRDKHNEYNRQWKLNNPDKHRENVKKQWLTLKSNADKLQKHYENTMNWNSKFRVYKPDVAKSRKAKYREELHDEYIKQLILNKSYGLLSAKDITTDIIKLKREQLILTRKLKNHE